MDNLVSIIVPCYNSGKFIEETLESVCAQSYTNWQCVIVDDGSTDNSREIIEKFVAKDIRFSAIHKANEGVAIARNTAIQASQGTYILPLDADDIIAPQYIEEAVKVLENNPDVKLVYCKAEKFGRKKGPWNLPDYDFKLLLSMNLIFCTALYRRADYNKSIGYNPNISGMEDWDFWLGFLKETDKVVRLEGVYFFYRTHKKSRNRSAVKNISEIHRQLYLNHKELYIDYIDNPIQVMKDYRKYQNRLIKWL